MNRHKRYPPEVRERAVRLVLEHQEDYNSQWAALTSIAGKIGCTAETLRRWVRRAEVDQGSRPGVSKYVKSHLIRKLKSPLNPSTEVACMFSLRTGGHPCSSEETI